MDTLRGDRATRFSRLYERCYPAVYAYAARRVGPAAGSEIAAETFLIAWRRFDVMPAEPLPWLYRVARNVLLRYHATVARQAQTRSALAHEPVVRADVVADGNDERLWEAWGQLRERDREVLALVAWEELSVAQAAGVLGCATAVFSVRLHRARRRLAGLLASPPNASALEPSEAR